ncbi:MAG: DUF3160 domain-containing protein [Lachnospiraceae bacterium]|nr:DUF3160 domain-containing protein [Lachnospiraceae bacterium]
MKGLLKKTVSVMICVSLVFMSVSCGSSQTGADSSEETDEASAASEEATEEEATEEEGSAPASLFNADSKGDSKEAAENNSGAVQALFVRPTLIDTSLFMLKADTVDAAVPEYKIEGDFGNVINSERFYIQDEEREHLLQDGFYVVEGGSGEFHEVYESNRYLQTPSFITVDSLMHSYHLYFMYLLKRTEKDRLRDELRSLTDKMLTLTEKQRGEMKNPSDEWAEASDRNIAFFAVAKALLDPSYDPSSDKAVNSSTLDVIKSELKLIDEAGGISPSPLVGNNENEDYSQYKPRGYYETDENLKQYFKAMMWYGRRNFTQKSETLDRSALLMTCAMDEEAFESWSMIYAVTSFFAGASDDSGVCEYAPVIEKAYGKTAYELTGDMLMNDEAWDKFHEMTASLEVPAINSVPMEDDGGETDKASENMGFRFMGQRFSIDASIFQKLIYSAVGENKSGGRRMLPDALDIPAALGSGTAEDILRNDLKAMDYDGYEQNLKKLQEDIRGASDETWYTSLYSEWLNTLRPLLDEKGKGYPFFMQNENWKKKSLEGFLGSYTELKHDTVLYSKQVIAEMGGGDEEEVDFRGYVEPEPVIFSRFASMAEGTAAGLKKFGLSDSETEENLSKLTDIANRLHDISVKELKNETLTDDEYEFIKIYGGEIEHFWHEAYKDEARDSEYMDSRMFPAPVVVDVATDPNGSVLELGTANPATIYVVVPVEGILRIARGSVFSFYQFEQPISNRMTDHDWRVKLGIDPDDSGEYRWGQEELPDKPSWTESYRISY